MAIALRSTSTAVDQTAATFSVNKPAGAVDGDLLVAFEMCNLGSGAVPGTPTNWTLMGRVTNGITGDLACFYKVVAGDGASYTFNNSGTGLSPTAQVRINCWSGAATAPEAITTNSGTGTTATALSITTAAANEYLSAAFGVTLNTGETITPQVITDQGSIGGTAAELSAGYVLQAGAGASGNKTATLSGSLFWYALLVAIPEAAGGGGATGSTPGGGGIGVPLPLNPFASRTASRRSGRRR